MIFRWTSKDPPLRLWECPLCKALTYELGVGCRSCFYVTLCDRETLHDEIRGAMA